MTTIYTNKIINIGKDVSAFGNEMIILFGDNAPDTLKDYCYTIPITPIASSIKPGQFFVIDGEKFKIIYVGDLAEKNLASLGHLTINFTNSEESTLPGAIVVEEKEHPSLQIDSVIEIIEE